MDGAIGVLRPFAPRAFALQWIDRCIALPKQDQGRTTVSSFTKFDVSRRTLLTGVGAAAAAAAVPTGWAFAQAKPLKIGLMLPYSGAFAKLGENITFAIELLIAEKGGKLGGRDIQIIKLDDESKPEAAPQNVDRLVKRDEVDVLIG